MSTTAERRAAYYRLTQADAPLALRTWHGARITEGAHSGLRGFLIGTCPHAAGRLRLLLPAGGPIVCCLPLSALTGSLTLHGGVRCPGADCTEGDVVEVTA